MEHYTQCLGVLYQTLSTIVLSIEYNFMNTSSYVCLLVQTLFITVTNYFNTLSIIQGVHAHSPPAETTVHSLA